MTVTKRTKSLSTSVLFPVSSRVPDIGPYINKSKHLKVVIIITFGFIDRNGVFGIRFRDVEAK